MTRIDGKQVAQELKEEIREQVTQMKARGIEPCLAVILVGDDPASRVYVTNKEKDCAECGIVSREYKLPERRRRKNSCSSLQSSMPTARSTGFWYSFRCRGRSMRAE